MFQPGSTNTQKQKTIVKQRFFDIWHRLTEAMARSDPRTKMAYVGQCRFLNKNLKSASGLTTKNAILKRAHWLFLRLALAKSHVETSQGQFCQGAYGRFASAVPSPGSPAVDLTDAGCRAGKAGEGTAWQGRASPQGWGRWAGTTNLAVELRFNLRSKFNKDEEARDWELRPRKLGQP